MIEDEIISQQPLATPQPAPLVKHPKTKHNYTKLFLLLGLPFILLLFLLLYLSLTNNSTSPGNSSTKLSPSLLPTIPPELDLTYPFATDSTLLDTESSVSGTIDPNINQLLYLLQLPDINHPINQ